LSATSCRAARDVSRSLVGSPVASRVLPGRDKGGQGTRASACRCTALRACCGRQSTRGDGARRRELSAGNGTGAPFAFLYPPTITSKICGMRLAARERLDHGLARLAEEAMTTSRRGSDAFGAETSVAVGRRARGGSEPSTVCACIAATSLTELRLLLVGATERGWAANAPPLVTVTTSSELDDALVSGTRTTTRRTVGYC
jgi:hypothetical protein